MFAFLHKFLANICDEIGIQYGFYEHSVLYNITDYF